MLARVRPLAVDAGVTRLADLTGLDRIGLPIWQAVRPLSRSLAVSLGKGAKPATARLSALVETIELHRAERLAGTGPPRPASASEAAIWARVPPAYGQSQAFDPARNRHWLPAVDLIGGGRIDVPVDAASMDLARPIAADIRPNSNGLASGSDRDEAIVAALLELLEREAQARWLALPAGGKRATRIMLRSISDRGLRAALARVERAGLRLIAWDMGGAIGVPAYYCALIEPGPRAAVVLPPGIGSACDPDPALALAAAIGEAAQARVMFIAGARDDLADDDYRDPAGQRLKVVQETLAFDADGDRPWRAEPAWAGQGNAALRDWLVARCIDAGACVLPCIDVAGGDTGLATIKLFAPGFGDDDRPSAFR